MADSVFDYEKMLDISVNIIPMVIIGFFVVLFLVASPWTPDFFIDGITLVLHIVPFVLLGFLTYLAAHYI